MRAILLLAIVFFVEVLCENEYTSKFDNIDVDSILKNDRLLKNYVNCLLDRGGCPSDAAELKKTIPDALKTGCSKCSEKQKNGIRRVIKYMSVNRKNYWDELLQKYDPEGSYRKKYADMAKEEGVHV